MDRYSDRMGSRYDRGSERDRYDRDDRYDRYDRDDRYERDSRDYYDRDRNRRPSRDMSDSGAVADIIEKSNREQMDKIADYFDEAREDRLESEKNITRMVGDNSQMLMDIAASLKNISGGVVAAPVVETEEFFDEPSVDPSAKDEILKVVADNKQLLTLIRQDMITVTQRQAEESSRMQSAEGQFDMPDFLLAERAEQLYKDMEEHVHMENVKCYRNVQAALQEQNGEGVKEFTKSLTGIKIVSILSLVFSVVTMVFLAAFIFGII